MQSATALSDASRLKIRSVTALLTKIRSVTALLTREKKRQRRWSVTAHLTPDTILKGERPKIGGVG